MKYNLIGFIDTTTFKLCNVVHFKYWHYRSHLNDVYYPMFINLLTLAIVDES